MTTRTLSLPGVELVHDVLGASEGRPLVMIGQPMTAEGFHALAAELPERRVVLYDPRGLGRSVRSDGDDTSVPEVQAGDLHALVESLGGGPVDVFASSGGAVAGLAWVTAYPEDIATLVAHEPPVLAVLPDAEAANRANAQVGEAYRTHGFGAGMARFIGMINWRGEYTEDYFAQPAPDPAMFGLPTEDDGSRDDALLSGRAAAVTAYAPDLDALRAAGGRVVLAVGEESRDQLPGRCADALAAQLGTSTVVFPSQHGGFSGENDPYPGQAKAFAVRLREVLGS